jgi:hypothetical protein
MHRRMVVTGLAAGLGLAAAPALAQDAKPEPPKLDLAKSDLPKLPADASVRQVTRVAGKTLAGG